jgi:glycosyltransferase involved in cell wall biosynthesis
MPSLWVLLPAHNESANIAEVVAGVRAVHIDGVDVHALVVDDGSRDDTAALARAAGAEVISHPRNRGVGAAFRTGRDHALAAGADFLIHMDSDGQVLPAEIPRVAGPVLGGEADLALGSRFSTGEPPRNLERWKAFGLTSIARTIGLLTGYRLTDISCGFRCMNRKVMEAARPTFDYDYIQETLIQALAIGARVVEVPVTVLYEHEPARPGMSARTLRYGRRFLGLTAFGMANFYRARARRLIGR